MRTSLILLICLMGIACGQGEQPTSANNTEDAASSETVYYPFPQYLMDEMAYIDSTPVAISYTTRRNGNLTDSGYLAKPQLRQMVQTWAADDPNGRSLKNHYTESSFQDLTLNTLTFSITSTKPELRLQQADILLEPETKKVKTVILKQSWQAADSSVQQTVLWTHHMRCQVSRQVQKSNGESYQQIQEYIWDRPLQ